MYDPPPGYKDDLIVWDFIWMRISSWDARAALVSSQPAQTAFAGRIGITAQRGGVLCVTCHAQHRTPMHWLACCGVPHSCTRSRASRGLAHLRAARDFVSRQGRIMSLLALEMKAYIVCCANAGAINCGKRQSPLQAASEVRSALLSCAFRVLVRHVGMCVCVHVRMCGVSSHCAWLEERGEMCLS